MMRVIISMIIDMSREIIDTSALLATTPSEKLITVGLTSSY